MHSQTTIAAIATPPGRGGVGVIRLSGPKAYDIAQKLTQKNLPEARMAGFRKFFDADGERKDKNTKSVKRKKPKKESQRK